MGAKVVVEGGYLIEIEVRMGSTSKKHGFSCACLTTFPCCNL